MKSPLLIVLVTAVLVAVGTLVVMNNACKSGQHAWCAPKSTVQRHIKPGHGYFPKVSNRLAVLFLRPALI
jgi:hypothetical protein